MSPRFSVADETFDKPLHAWPNGCVNTARARFWFWYYRDPSAAARLCSF